MALAHRMWSVAACSRKPATASHTTHSHTHTGPEHIDFNDSKSFNYVMSNFVGKTKRQQTHAKQSNWKTAINYNVTSWIAAKRAWRACGADGQTRHDVTQIDLFLFPALWVCLLVPYTLWQRTCSDNEMASNADEPDMLIDRHVWPSINFNGVASVARVMSHRICVSHLVTHTHRLRFGTSMSVIVEQWSTNCLAWHVRVVNWNTYSETFLNEKTARWDVSTSTALRHSCNLRTFNGRGKSMGWQWCARLPLRSVPHMCI